MPRDFDGSIEQYRDLVFEQSENAKINVLLLGPNTKNEKEGTKLRRYIKNKCKGEQNARSPHKPPAWYHQPA